MQVGEDRTRQPTVSFKVRHDHFRRFLLLFQPSHVLLVQLVERLHRSLLIVDRLLIFFVVFIIAFTVVVSIDLLLNEFIERRRRN